ncbi:MAG: SDR family NAD(P)-dependent oxidoreductase, partial [Jatrophihabitans sp.]
MAAQPTDAGWASTEVQVTPIAADLAEASEVERLATESLAALDGLDILVNNAGISIPESIGSVTARSWDAVMAVNVRAPALLSARIGAAMSAAARGGSIINIASAAATPALAEHYSYCTSKAALLMIPKMLAIEFGPAGVRSNVVCPTA